MKRLLIIVIVLAAALIAGCTQTPGADNQCVVGTEDGILMMGVDSGSLTVTGPLERDNASLEGVEFCQQRQQV